MNRSRFLAALGAALLLAQPGLALAQAPSDWPQRPVKIILPAGPGGTSDILMRLMTDSLGKSLGQPVVLEHRPGAGGTLAATLVAQSEPDGYTLMVNSAATHGIAPWMYRLKFDPDKDVAGVAQLAFTPNVLYVRKDSPFKSVRDLVAYGKANPGKLNYSSSGSGTSLHLSSVLFSMSAGIETVHIPYNGAAPAMTAVLAGDVAYSFENAISVMGQIRGGAVRPLAVTTATRSPQLPDVPTVMESGVPGFSVSGWFGIVAPGATPRAVVDKLTAAFERAVKDPQIMEQIRKLGAEPEYLGPRAFDAFMRSERQKWEGPVKSSGAKVG
jgi:tripartite-type tricarboxylate transporter receptor subunit TctC